MMTHIKTKEDIVRVQSQLLDLVGTLQEGKTYDCEIKRHREARSLDANSYFHLLVNKIAAKIGESNEDTKRRLVLDYGAIAEIDGGVKFAVQVPKGADIRQFYPYAKWYGEIVDNGIIKDKFLLYKHTHALNSKEMARLIDGAVQEAQQLGIETRTPAQLAELKSLWGQA